MNARYRHILSDYRAADVTKRLHIYMQFPHLRSEFVTIDRNAPNGNPLAATEGLPKSRGHRNRGRQ